MLAIARTSQSPVLDLDAAVVMQVAAVERLQVCNPAITSDQHCLWTNKTTAKIQEQPSRLVVIVLY